MVSDRRLLVMSCSKRKFSDSGLLPAIERYAGPAFQVLNRFQRECPDAADYVDVFILSAAFGIIASSHPIPDYDQVMTRRRSRKLHTEALADFEALICDGYLDLCLAMSKKYLETLAGWSKLISSEITVTVTDGPQGKKLAQLKQWLWQDKISQEENKTSSIQVSGSACLRGIELQMTSDEAVERIKTFLSKEKDRDGSERFRNWYVNIDGQRVAVKWMVSKLTGLSVSDFTTGEAKRVLAQLGVNIESIVK